MTWINLFLIWPLRLQGSSHVWSAGVHRSVRLFDINQGTELKAGSHEDTVR